MGLFENIDDIILNGNSASKAFLNGDEVWSLVEPTPTPTETPIDNIILSNLVLYFDPSNSSSYPGSGTTITDLSDSGLSGTMSNITYTSPYFTYNGSNSQVSIADNSVLEPGSGDWTVEVWVNQSVSGNDVILGKFNSGGEAQHVGYSIRTLGSSVYAQYGSGSGSGTALFQDSTSYTVTPGTWYQIVYVFTNVASNTFETFVNGSSIGSVGHNLSSILNTTTGLYIGSYNNGEYAQYFDGKIGIVRIYNKALTSSEVLQNYNADNSKYIEVTPTPTPTPTSAPVGEFIYVAQTGIAWNGYGGNYLSFGRSQDGTNKTPLAGWYFRDSNNVVRQLLNTPLWFSGGNPSPYPNGNGWMAVANGSFTISASETTITFYETSPI